MFVLTINKTGLKKVAVVAVCVMALATVGLVVGNRIKSNAAAQPTMAAGGTEVSKTVKNTEDLASLLLAYGVDCDIATAEVNRVKIPKKWDASFEAFNEVILQSGMDLSRYKGKKVDKWSIVSPGRSTGEQSANAIVLVYKEKAIGGYILLRPSGEVLPLRAEVLQPTDISAGTETGAAAEVAADPAAMPTE